MTKNFFRMTKPGGWIQLGEAILSGSADAGPASRDFYALMQAVFVHLGQDPHFAENSLRKWLEDAGYVDIHEKTIKPYVGKSQPDPKLREATIKSSCFAIAGLLGFAKSKST